MQKIPLTRGLEALVDDGDALYLSSFSWFATTARGNSPVQYAATNNGGNWPGQPNTILMHRLLLGFPAGVDHIDHNGLNNQRSNLRPSSQTQNLANQRKTRGMSEYKGVGWHKARQKWRAYIGTRPDHIGLFDSEIEAARAYDEEALNRWGEHAHTNFPKENYA